MSVPKVNKVVNPGIVARNFVIFTMARTRPLRAKIVARTYDFFPRDVADMLCGTVLYTRARKCRKQTNSTPK